MLDWLGRHVLLETTVPTIVCDHRLINTYIGPWIEMHSEIFTQCLKKPAHLSYWVEPGILLVTDIGRIASQMKTP